MELEKIGSLLDSLKKIKENLNTDKNSWQEKRRKHMQMESGMGELRKKLDSMASRIEMVQQRLLESKKIIKKRGQSFTDAAHQETEIGPVEDQKDLKLPKDNVGRSKYRKMPKEQRLLDSEERVKEHDQSWTDEAHQETKNGPGEDQEGLRLPKKNKVRSEDRQKLVEQTIADSESRDKEHDQNWTDEAHQETKNGPGEDQEGLRLLKKNKVRSEDRQKSVEQTIADSESRLKEHDLNWTDEAHQETKNGLGEDQKGLRLPKKNKVRSEDRQKSVEQTIADSESRLKEHDLNWTDEAHQETKNGPGEDQKGIRLLKENNGRSEYRQKAVEEIIADSEIRVKEHDQNWTDEAHQKTKNGPGEEWKKLKLLKKNVGRFGYRTQLAEQRRPDSKSRVKDHDQSLSDLKRKKPRDKAVENFVLQGRQII
uniref:Myb-like protein X n=1 Tax=Phascolarctos cinereus TaxID=38626 RepID=A0A6P5K9K3_PHACI|nr:myb-like protein X [Phascolarctos cinereus]